MHTHQHFHPVILFHDQQVAYGDPYYQPMIQIKKERTNEMLRANSQWWQHIAMSMMDDANDDDGSGGSNSSNSPLSTASSCSSFSPTPCLTSPLHHQPYMSHQSAASEKSRPTKISKDIKPSMTTNTNHVKRRRGNLPKSVTAILKQWLMDHFQHPYPTEQEKMMLCRKKA